MTRVLVVAVLVAVYAIVLGSADAADLATGALLAVAVLALTRQLGDRASGPAAAARRLVAFFPWLAIMVREVVLGTWAVARTTLRPGSGGPAGIVAIPIGERSPRGLAVSAFAATVSPGEVVVEIDEPGAVMLLHVLDAADPDAVRERHQGIYDRYQSKVFP